VRKAEAAWRECPELEQVRCRLQVLEQAGQMAQEELGGIERLVEQGQYEQAQQMLASLQASTKGNPHVQRRAQEIADRIRSQRLGEAVRKAEAAEQAGQFHKAQELWSRAAEMAGEDAGRRARLLARARQARERGRAEEAGLPFEPEELSTAATEPPVTVPTVPVRRRPRGRKVLFYLLPLAGVALVVLVGMALYRRHARKLPLPPPMPASPAPGGAAVPHQAQSAPSAPQMPAPPPAPATGEPSAPPRFFVETFDSLKADRWEVKSGQWMPAAVAGRVFRSLADEGEALAVHRFYDEQDCGVEAWVRVDVADSPQASVAISARMRGDDELRLQIERHGDGFLARLMAMAGGQVVAQSEPAPLHVGGGAPFEGTLRIDALGRVAVGSVDAQVVGVLKALPAALMHPGRAALRASHCRASWDEVMLAEARAEAVAAATAPPAPPQPQAPRTPPLDEVKPAAGVEKATLESYCFAFSQGFDANDAGWRASSGPWERVRGGYGFGAPASGTSFATLGTFADVELRAMLSVGGRAEGEGEASAGLLVRYRDAGNYVLFGLAAVEGGWDVRLTVCRGGEKQEQSAPGGPYALEPGQKVELALAAVGPLVCGSVGGKPVLSARVAGEQVAGGQVGLSVSGLGAVFDDVRLRALQPVAAAQGEPAGGLRLEVPGSARLSAAAPPALLRLGECGGRYVFLEGLVSGAGRMSVQLRLEKAGRYPQFSLCGAAQGSRGPVLTQLVDFYPDGRADVRLVGVMPAPSGLRPLTYAAGRLGGLKFSEPLALSLALGEQGAECSLDGNVLRAQRGAPLPGEPGKWGFRCTDAVVRILRLELEL